MASLSVVIITKNEARNIVDCIRSAYTISDEVIVVDSGSTDATIQLAEKAGAKVVQVQWQCYGHSRNTGANIAKYDWILALDADERISSDLADDLKRLTPTDNCFYKIRRLNFFANRQLQFGIPGFDHIARLYNRKMAEWDLFPVHEKLHTASTKCFIKAPILHFGITTSVQDKQKKECYARLSAQKYLQQKKKATLLKRYLAPAFEGVKSYVFLLGFLDGRNGWQVAKIIAHYTWLKYNYLHRMQNEQAKQPTTLTTNVGRITSPIKPSFAER